MPIKTIRPDFVETIPDILQDGILYISIPFATATHKCPCGCGEIVVTPIKPEDWKLQWDGETVTLKPSIGNWSLPCRSHYWIIENNIVWSRNLSNSEVAEKRRKDTINRNRYYKKLKRIQKES